MLKLVIVKIYLFFFLFGEFIFAHPVSYKDAIGVMTWNQPFMSDSWITYSLSPKVALAGRLMRMQMPEGELNYYGLQYDYLVQRWNGDDYQANIYIYGSVGDSRFLRNDDFGYLAGFEADAENRKYFALIKAETMQTDLTNDFNHIEARLGVAPYEAEYNELATWFMAQAQWHPTLEREFVLTPLARIFYKSFLFESGVSLQGDSMMNFMFHF